MCNMYFAKRRLTRTAILMCAMAILLTGISVEAQKKSQPAPSQPAPIGPPVRQKDPITIEDDATGNFLVIQLDSGAYKFHRCKDGFGLSGTGVVKVDGCAISFEDNQDDHRVVASINECTQEAKALVEQFAPVPGFTYADAQPSSELLSDRDLRDNTLKCVPKQ